MYSILIYKLRKQKEVDDMDLISLDQEKCTKCGDSIVTAIKKAIEWENEVIA